MGADNLFMSVKGGNELYVRKKFKERQDYDGEEHGRGSYQGNWSNVDNIKFTDKIFKSTKEAQDYLFETCEKWGDGLVVQARNNEGQLIWVIGACVAC